MPLALLSGPMAVGKTSVSNVLVEEFGFEKIGSGDYLRALAAGRGITPDRTALQELGDGLDALTDFRWLVTDVAVPKIGNDATNKSWLIDAVRKRRQVYHFRELWPDLRHIYLRSSESVLRDRYAHRAEAVPYDIAQLHPNEVATRDLEALADLTIDAGRLTAREIAGAIVGSWGTR